MTGRVLFYVSYTFLAVGAFLGLFAQWAAGQPPDYDGANIGLGLLALSVPWVLGTGLATGLAAVGATLLKAGVRRGSR